MNSTCPDCEQSFNGKKCKCGYVQKGFEHIDNQSLVEACVHYSFDKLNQKTWKKILIQKCSKFECQNPGTISSGGPFYCSEHFIASI